MFEEKRNFLSARAYEALLKYREEASFEPVLCEEDGQTYERIARDIPSVVRREVEFGVGMLAKKLFLRERPKGIAAPQHVHHDAPMGRRALVYYLNDGPRFSGTSFVRHRALGVSYAPMLEGLQSLLWKDANQPEVWAEVAFSREEANKACIFDPGYLHLAKPLDGYGEGTGARCVLTGFF